MSLAILFGTFLWYSDKKERYGPIPFLFVWLFLRLVILIL